MDFETVKAWIAAHYTDRRHVLYLRTGNPVHAWAAYRTARQLQVLIPSWVLDSFDTWADVLTNQTHTSKRGIADALKIGKEGGGETVTSKAARDLRDLEIVADVLSRRDALPPSDELKALAKKRGIKIDDVFRGDRYVITIMEQVAEERGLSYESVRAKYYKMIRPLKRRAKHSRELP